MRRAIFSLLILGQISGCTVSSRFQVDDEPVIRGSSGPVLGVTKPAQCNEYPVEYRRGGSGSDVTMATVDVWLFARKPNPCRKQPTIEELDDKKKPFWRFWK